MGGFQNKKVRKGKGGVLDQGLVFELSGRNAFSHQHVFLELLE